MFLDAYEMNSSDDSGFSGKLGTGMDAHPGVIIFYSCSRNQMRFEIDELQHGSFTYSLLEELRWLQEDSNYNTVESLDKRLKSRIPQLNARYRKPLQNPYLTAEPPHKIYLILLKENITFQDAQQLKYEAYNAEQSGNLDLAKQLWIIVLAVFPSEVDAVEAIKRVDSRISTSELGVIPFTLALTTKLAMKLMNYNWFIYLQLIGRIAAATERLKL